MKPFCPKPQLYAYYFAELQEIAREHGYNLMIHGSLSRDCDLVAVPWIDEPKTEIELIGALNKMLTGYVAAEGFEKEIHLFKELPGGRHGWVINLSRGHCK